MSSRLPQHNYQDDYYSYENTNDRYQKRLHLIEYIIEHFNNGRYIDLSDLDFTGYKINLSGLKAKNIDNSYQVSKSFISNVYQRADKQITNAGQLTKTIDNQIQTSEFINNSEQEAEKIYQTKQRGRRVIT